MNWKKDISKKDDAVSPVIALMLILAILATCMAVYTTTYVPGLKQQDEITHSGEVKLAFERFASDIDNVIALGKPAVYTEVLELGGGDVPLSPTKSSGTVEINTTVIGNYTIGSETKNLYGIEISYLPSFTAWEKQGYIYKNGVVWIVKDEKKTPAALKCYTTQNGTDAENATIKKWYPKIQSGTVFIPIFKTGENTEISGSSPVKLMLNARVGDVLPSVKIVFVDGTTQEYSGVRFVNIEVSVE